MQKPVVYLIVIGGLLTSGIFLSFYGAQLTTQDLSVKEAIIGGGKSLEIMIELDPAKSENGVYVVQVMELKDGIISAKILDPVGYQILSTTIDKESFEERFEISSKGNYTLSIENLGSDDMKIVGVLGHMPDNSTLSVGVTGFYILIIGLIGIVGVGIYAVKNRSKEKLS
jgi:hypothetical protein